MSPESFSEIAPRKVFGYATYTAQVRTSTLSLSQAWLAWTPGWVYTVMDGISHLRGRHYLSWTRAEPSGQLATKHHLAPFSLARGFLVDTETELRPRLSSDLWLSRSSCCAKDRRPRCGIGFSDSSFAA